jgi:hypothetical protein
MNEFPHETGGSVAAHRAVEVKPSIATIDAGKISVDRTVEGLRTLLTIRSFDSRGSGSAALTQMLASRCRVPAERAVRRKEQ